MDNGCTLRVSLVEELFNNAYNLRASWSVEGSRLFGETPGINNGERGYMEEFLAPLLSELEGKIEGFSKSGVPIVLDLTKLGSCQQISVENSVRYSYADGERFRFIRE